MMVTSTSEFRMEPVGPLTASLGLTDWMINLPRHALLSPITMDHGSQRDPVEVMVGLRAKWTESR